MSNPKMPPAGAKSTPAGAVTTEDTKALTGQAPAKTEDKPRRRIVVSQGAYDDLVRLRKVTDPGTGLELRVDDDGKVTAYDRSTGDLADIEVVCPVVLLTS